MATRKPNGLLGRFDALERQLTAKGFPRLSPFWRRTLRGFYRSDRRQLVLRVGRRGGKSSSLCRVAVVEALYGEHVIPPGDMGVVAIISVSRDEAAQRVRTVRAILDALGVPHRPIDGGVELLDRPVCFKTYAASIAGVSGFTSIACICDEVSKWRDADSGANPATEVLASLRPTMATQRRARIFLSSSPLGLDDAHARAFDGGETARQTVAYAPTWLANPSITEQETRDDEPDERIWRREYLAEPQAGVLGAFDPDSVAGAFDRVVDVTESGAPLLVLDPSSGRSDAWTWAIVRSVETAAGVRMIQFDLVDGIEGKFWKQTTGEQIVERLVGVAKAWGVKAVHADQRESLMLEAAFRKAGLKYVIHDWTASSKPAAVELVRRWLVDGALLLPDHSALRREMLAFEERITPSGAFTFGARGSGHDDYVALLLTAAMATLDGKLTRRDPGPTPPCVLAGWTARIPRIDVPFFDDRPERLSDRELSGLLASTVRR